MSSKVKFLVSLVIVCVIGSVSLIYYISSQIRPEGIKKEIISAIEKNIPGSKASINDLTFSLGLVSSFSIKQIEIKDSNQKTLLSSSLINVNIPIWAIIKGGGVIDVKLNDPLLFFNLYINGTNNWFTSIKTDQKNLNSTSKVKTSKQTIDSQLSIPVFVENSKVNFSVMKAKLDFTNKGSRSQFDIDKILFKNLSLNHTTAYEVKSKLEYEVDAENKLKLDLQIIGEIDLREYLAFSKAQLSSLMTMKNIELGGIKIPVVKNILKLNYDKNRSIEIDNRLEVGTILNSNFSMNISKMFDLINIKNLDTNIDLTQIKNFIKDIPRVNTGKLSISGAATLNLNSMSLSPSLQIMSSKDISIILLGETIISKVKGRLSEQTFSLDLTTKLLDSNLSTKLNTKINIMDIPEDLSKLSPINIGIVSSGLKVSRKFISSVLYPKSKKQNEAKSIQNGDILKEKQTTEKLLLLPPLITKLNFKNLQLDNELLTVFASINAKGKEVKSKIEIKGNNTSKGDIKLNLDTLIDTKSISSLVTIKIKEFRFINITALLPPFLSEIQGIVNGSIKGDIVLGDILKYSLASKLVVNDGEIKGLNLSDFIQPYLKNVSFLKKQDTNTNFSDNFKVLSFSGNLKDDIIIVNDLYFQGNKDSLSLELKGNVSMLDKKSTLTGTSNIKGAGVKNIPVQMSGVGFGLIPVIKYTTDKLTENIYKSTVKKEKKKAKESVEKSLKKEARKLLKGLKF